MTDARLRCVAAMVGDGAVLADIGTDHAYLPITLVQAGRARRAIAADIGEGPAASARDHVRAANLDDVIDVRVGDGLSVIAPEEYDRVTDIVIAGMGGETIAAIISAAPWCKRCRLILQPMTKTTELRRWLHDNGFAIEEEHLVRDGHHLYTAFRAVFAGGERPPVLADYVGALGFEEGLPYFEQQLSHLNRRIDGMARGGNSPLLDRLKTIAAQLAAYIESKGGTMP